MSTSAKISVKQAVESAMKFVMDLYGEGLINLLLEEVSLSDDEKTWVITLGFSRPKLKTPFEEALATITPDSLRSSNFDRVYKSIEIDSQTGEAKAMRIRDPASPAI